MSVRILWAAVVLMSVGACADTGAEASEDLGASAVALETAAETLSPAEDAVIAARLTRLSEDLARESDPRARTLLRVSAVRETIAAIASGRAEDGREAPMERLGELRIAILRSPEAVRDAEAAYAEAAARGATYEPTPADLENAERTRAVSLSPGRPEGGGR